MKVEFYEETTVQKKERYVADDGTVFDDEADCIYYEERRKLDDMPYPPTVSVPAPLENYDVCISLLKSPLDFKKLLTEYQDTPANWEWDLYGMMEPTAYPCLYAYYVDGESRIAGKLSFGPSVLIDKYFDIARKLSVWCAQQCKKMCEETEI